MADWVVWLIMAGVLIGLEIFTGTFYLLMVGLGFAAGSLTAFLGGARPLQFIVAALIGVLAAFFLRRKQGLKAAQNAASDPNVNIDIGQAIRVGQWQELGKGNYSSRAMYRGSMWDVDLMPGAAAVPGLFIIRELRGSRLLVSDHSVDGTQEER